ncbi:TlpA family protein disulfide reductase [Pusillimonas sp. DMV24BSW_D]|uniref:TlpA disulfide reductase family protein n=1 Tax=Neopusillimonas aestuarii TaxID=2716226 RepID=UPI00140B1A1B|nr:TlpA disulfide reductase family protein [Pusillimonas sp. DMV24BSW_D]QIM48661.1 TlpA family protein disulfide reductase [Pusillimonas sp. DMV24BSW_D]
MKALKIGIVVAIALVGLLAWQLSSPSRSAPQVGFTSLKNEQFSTEDLRGKVVLVKFWATSCVTCIQQMPDTIETYQQYAPKGYEVVAVAMDYDPVDYVRTYAQTRNLPFTVVHDASGDIARAFGNVQLTPTAFLIDKQGNIVKRYLGNYNKAEFINTVEQALAG